MKIDWSKIDWSRLVPIVICAICGLACVWRADLFLDDMQTYVDNKIGSTYFMLLMIFFLFNSFDNNRGKEIAELKKEVEELRNSMVQ